jgi:hypothetical protein
MAAKEVKARMIPREALIADRRSGVKLFSASLANRTGGPPGAIAAASVN